MPGAYLDRSPANSWPSVQYNKLDNPHIVEFAPNVVMDDRDFPIANRVFAGPLGKSDCRRRRPDTPHGKDRLWGHPKEPCAPIRAARGTE